VLERVEIWRAQPFQRARLVPEQRAAALDRL
jgi:hypothetical protein